MNKTTKLIAGSALAMALIGGAAAGVAVATGAGGDDNEPAITGDALDVRAPRPSPIPGVAQ